MFSFQGAYLSYSLAIFPVFCKGVSSVSLFLAVTPAEASNCRGYRVPLVHVAYAVGDGGRLMRSELPRGTRGGLLGLSDRCAGSLPETSPLCRAIAGECSAHRFGGVFADFEGAVCEDRLSFLSRLGAMLAQSGRLLYVPERFAVPEASILVCTALSGGTLRERLSDAVARYGANRVALDCQRLAMDFLLPCRSGEGTPLTPDELSSLRERCGAAVFFSEELCANYFSYQQNGRAHFVLFDTAETLRHKLRLGRERGMETAFLMYPEVSDLLPELLNA